MVESLGESSDSGLEVGLLWEINVSVSSGGLRYLLLSWIIPLLFEHSVFSLIVC